MLADLGYYCNGSFTGKINKIRLVDKVFTCKFIHRFKQVKIIHKSDDMCMPNKVSCKIQPWGPTLTQIMWSLLFHDVNTQTFMPTTAQLRNMYTHMIRLCACWIPVTPNQRTRMHYTTHVRLSHQCSDEHLNLKHSTIFRRDIWQCNSFNSESSKELQVVAIITRPRVRKFFCFDFASLFRPCKR